MCPSSTLPTERCWVALMVNWAGLLLSMRECRYRADCKNCGIDSRRSLAAFLASDAYGAFNRQAAARKLLAGLHQWPEGSPATTIAESKSGGNLEVRWWLTIYSRQDEGRKGKEGGGGGRGLGSGARVAVREVKRGAA